jgi:Tol biopolymer transport system component
VLRGPTAARRLLPPLVLAVLLLAGCGGSSAPKGPPDLVFVSTRDGDYALFGADAKGRHARRLTKEKGDPSTQAGLFFQVDPAWSPDGQEIAFASLREGTGHIYVMRWDGTGLRRLTSGPKSDDHPSWSPDGKRIVFAREGALFVAPAAGGPARRIGKGPGSAADPAWSPDGKLIAYDYRRPGYASRELWVMRADGTGNRQLTNFGQLAAWPSWSPDGKRVAFHSNVRYGHLEIYTIGVDGKGLREVTQSTTDVFQPAWSPNGQGIAYASDGAIWVDHGGTETQLTQSKNNDLNPVWRPLHRA